MKFLAVSAVCLLISYAVLYLFHDVWALPEIVAKLPATAATMVVGFGINRFWTFKE